MIKDKIIDRLEVLSKKKQQVESEFIGDIVPHNGHVVWAINNETLEIKKAKFIKKDIWYGATENKEILINKNHTYIAALNKKNALKKFKKGVSGGKDVYKEPLNL